MDNEELEAAIDALDTLHFTVLSLVSSTNRSTRFTLLYYLLFPQQTARHASLYCIISCFLNKHAKLHTSHDVVLVLLQYRAAVHADRVNGVLAFRRVDRLLLQLHHVA